MTRLSDALALCVPLVAVMENVTYVEGGVVDWLLPPQALMPRNAKVASASNSRPAVFLLPQKTTTNNAA